MARAEKLFSEVEDLEKKSQILGRLTRDKLNLVVRTQSRIEFQARAEFWKPPFRMQVHPLYDVRLGLDTVTVQFDLLGERYFSRTEVAFDDWKLYLVFLNSLYRLQRRKHRRLKIPKSMSNQAFLMRSNESIWNEQCELIDLSEGGCSLRMTYQALEIPHKAVVLVDIQLGEFESFLQMGFVCYKRAEKHNGRSVVRIGVQFHPRKNSEQSVRKVMEHLTAEIFNEQTAVLE